MKKSSGLVSFWVEFRGEGEISGFSVRGKVEFRRITRKIIVRSLYVLHGVKREKFSAGKHPSLIVKTTKKCQNSCENILKSLNLPSCPPSKVSTVAEEVQNIPTIAQHLNIQQTEDLR